MHVTKYMAALFFAALPFHHIFAEEAPLKEEPCPCTMEEELSPIETAEEPVVDESGWKLVSSENYTVNFPTAPKVDKKAGMTTYSSLDSGTFPVVLYSLTVNQSKASFDAAEEVSSYLEKLSTYPSNLLHHEIAETDGEIVVDTICSDAKTKVFRCERMILVKNAIYTLTTLFFSNSAENHDYFVGHFVRTN